MIIQYSYKKLSSCKSKRSCKKLSPCLSGEPIQMPKHDDTIVIQT